MGAFGDDGADYVLYHIISATNLTKANGHMECVLEDATYRLLSHLPRTLTAIRSRNFGLELLHGFLVEIKCMER